MNFISQKFEDDCFPTAIHNALVWAGRPVEYSEILKTCEYIADRPPYAPWETGKYIEKYFKSSKPKLVLSLRKVLSTLAKDQAMILSSNAGLFPFFLTPCTGHAEFVYMSHGRILVANYLEKNGTVAIKELSKLQFYKRFLCRALLYGTIIGK